MKFLLLSFACFLPLHLLHGDEVEKAMLAAAQKCSDAGVANDWEAMVNHMPPAVVESMGGKEVVIDASKKGVQQMSADGVTTTKVTVGKPVERKEIKGTIYAVIPQELTMKVPPGILHAKGYMLGISKSPGTVWHFLSITKQSRTGLMEIYPDILGEIIFPEIEKPMLERK